MDAAEHYQFYLNQLLISNEASMATQVFYNCTPPSFGPMRRYTFDNYKSYHTSLNEIIHDFYLHRYEPMTLTCYVHLQCDRGSALTCLDWSEICDGKVDCLDGGRDKEHCWQLEVNDCEDDQYRCINGQCIPGTFFRDNTAIPDCLDGSDEYFKATDNRANYAIAEPVFECEDITCTHSHRFWKRPLASSCVIKPSDLLMEAMFLDKPKSVLDECWSAFLCILHVPYTRDPVCLDLCGDRACDETIRKTCPDMMYVPAVPLFFGHVYFVYTKNESKYRPNLSLKPQYVYYKEQLCGGLIANKPFLVFNNVTCHRF
ncbi:unnamed protein product [Rotaria sp. Silwood2]|nr:unnamed protein product [Rotaria sp. Silwood2]CAF4441589.1 unnamed protein product [Rotaria sp. Silwood2]